MRVLLLEDDYFIASGLAAELEALGATIVGPFRKTEDAVDGIESATAAILDAKIADETSFLLADCLTNQQKPFLFYTGVPNVVPQRFGAVKTFGKTTPVRVLFETLRRQENHRLEVQPDAQVVDIVPLLRHRARALMGDTLGADRLVEATLVLALRSKGNHGGSLDKWLVKLLESIYHNRGRDFML